MTTMTTETAIQMVDWQSESDLDSIRNSCDVLKPLTITQKKDHQIISSMNIEISKEKQMSEFKLRLL